MTKNARQLPSRSEDKRTGLTVLDDTYTFDANGNVLSIVDGAQAGLTTRDMAYDGLDRLSVATSTAQWGVATYAYDPLDNLRVADQGARQYRYNYDALNRLTDIKSPAGALIHSFGYDASGNTTNKNAQAYVFDSANRMNQVTGVQTYRYDGQGRRVQTTDADTKTTFWIYSQSKQVMYTSEARRSQNLSYIYLGNTQVATRAVAWGTGTIAVRYQHTDSLGSPVAETDAAGMLVSRHSYAPYGEVLGSTPIDGTGYTGHVMDRDTGLTYMQQRYYDPIVGRFLSVDPVRTNENSGENFSRYTYVNSNPYTLVDPDGREFEYPKGTPADFINNVASAFNGLNKIGRADGVGYLHLSSARVKIVPTADRADATQNRFNPKTKTIYWADQAAFEVKDVESGKVGVISPKTTLGHEIEHAINYIDSPKGFSADAKTPDPDFGNMEERTVIQGWEHETSRAAGEPLRGDHKSGKSVPFKCVGDGCK